MIVSAADERVNIAEEAYLFGFPIVLMEVTRRLTAKVPAGAGPGSGLPSGFAHMRAFPPGDFKQVVRPNFDTLYSSLWFDLRDEPVVVSVSDTAERYYMLPFMDMWTDVFALVGSRTTGTGPGRYVLVGPGWSGELPEDVERIDAPTPFGWVIGRTRTDGVQDYDAVHIVQDGFAATSLSGLPSASAASAPTDDIKIDTTVSPLDQVLALPGHELLRRTAELMTLHPPHAVDQPILARMRRLGIVAGELFDVTGLDPDLQSAIEAGADAARDRMVRVAPTMFPVIDGWSLPTSGMGVYGTDYLRRAVVAKIGLGANRVEDAVYPVLARDSEGAVPTGEVDYVLHFGADALPPADAFWSVTMYDGSGFPVPNALDRYALGDRDPLAFNTDGSLDLYLQHHDPGDDRRSNWLPSPLGKLGVTLRLYDPRPEALDRIWTPPPLTPTAVRQG
jgi:hypothetical protein